MLKIRDVNRMSEEAHRKLIVEKKRIDAAAEQVQLAEKVAVDAASRMEDAANSDSAYLQKAASGTFSSAGEALLHNAKLMLLENDAKQQKEINRERAEQIRSLAERNTSQAEQIESLTAVVKYMFAKHGVSYEVRKRACPASVIFTC